MTQIESILAGYLNFGQTYRALGMSPQGVDYLVASGRLSPISTPAGRLFPADEVERLREARQSRQPRKPTA